MVFVAILQGEVLFVPARAGPDREQHGLPIIENLGESVADFATLAVDLRELARRASGCGNSPDTCGVDWREIDRVVSRPGAAHRVRRIAQRRGTAARGEHLLQFADRKETDPTAIW